MYYCGPKLMSLHLSKIVNVQKKDNSLLKPRNLIAVNGIG